MSHKVQLTFSKTADMRFISHLDLMRLFHRACRRARLPVSITQGFSPHLKISITKALKLGLESGSEEAVLCLDQEVRPEEIVSSLNASLPEGVRIVRAEALSSSKGE